MFVAKAGAYPSKAGFWPGKGCEGQTHLLITKIRKLWTKKFNSIGPSAESYETFSTVINKW
jgi:hypothetical protein